MKALVRLVVAVVLLAAVVACSRQVETGSEASTGTTEAVPSGPVASSVTWPPEGCATMSGLAIDYVSDAPGYSTREEAALAAVPTGASVVAAPKSGTSQQWIVLDQEGAPVAAVEMFQAQNGYLVHLVHRCADPPQQSSNG